jgi:hypothetical protein
VISVGFYVITVVIAYLTARESFPDLPAFQWVAPALLATLPAYTDKMSALNNDVGSVLVFSFLMWGSVRLIRRGISPLRIIWVISSSAAGVFTKRTALVGVLIAFLAIVLATRDWNWKTLMLGSGALFAAGIPLTLNQSASAHWYIVGDDQTPARIAEDAIMGEHSLRINPGQNLVQEMTRAKQDTLKGKIVTVGGWIRTDAPLTTTVRAISLYDGKQHHRPQMDVDQTWKFHAFTTKVDLQATTLQVRLASEKTKGASQPTSIYFDGIILTMGNFPLDKKPQFDSAQAEQGQWGDNRFNNFIKNASGEQVWLTFRPWVTSIANLSMIRGRASTLFLQSILDWRRTSWIYQPALKNLFQSFWARFGWNHVGLEDGRYEWIYWVLAGLTMTSFIGISRIFWRRIDLLRQPSTWQERIIVLFISSTLLVLLLTLLGYSHPQLTTVRDVRASVARYAYPAIIPIVILLCLGWHECVPGKWHPYLPLGVLLLGAILDLVSLWGVIIPFYYH